MALELRSIEPRHGVLAKVGRRLLAVIVRRCIRCDERYLEACQRGGIYGEADFTLMRHRIQAQRCHLIQLER